jgi:hypothetical protein
MYGTVAVMDPEVKKREQVWNDMSTPTDRLHEQESTAVTVYIHAPQYLQPLSSLWALVNS